MFSIDDFTKLQFLEGRWKGQGPGGEDFYEEYDRPHANMFRSRRFADASFATCSDGSEISYQDGEVTARWGEFTWRATSIDAAEASFEPVNAPSRFTWRRVDDSTLEAEQRWQAEGKEQQYTISMTKIRQ